MHKALLLIQTIVALLDSLKEKKLSHNKLPHNKSGVNVDDDNYIPAASDNRLLLNRYNNLTN